MKITIKPIEKGKAFTLCEVIRNGRSTVQKFIQSLPPPNKTKLLRLIVHIAKHGPPSNTEKFRHEEDKIFAIKVSQIRIYCFYDRGKLILLTNGLIKKDRKASRSALDTAKRIRDQYLKEREIKNEKLRLVQGNSRKS